MGRPLSCTISRQNGDGMKQTMTERVMYAAEILDFVQPGWAALVDLDTLDMASLGTDVAKQIGRKYELNYTDDVWRELTSVALIPADDEDYKDLTAAWRVAVGDRQRLLSSAPIP